MEYSVLNNDVVLRTCKTLSGAKRALVRLRKGLDFTRWQVAERTDRAFYGGGRVLRLWEFDRGAQQLKRVGVES